MHEVVGLALLLGEEDAEERRLEDEDMTAAHQLWEELEEEGDEQQAYVHPVVVGIGGDDHAIVAQAVEAVLDVERRLQEVELLVLIDDLLA